MDAATADGSADVASAAMNDELKSDVSPEVEEPVSSEPSGGGEPIDKLTALETLQLLKEYKKREFLYIAHISSLQKELHLQSNATSLSSSSLTAFNQFPSPYYPITEQGQLALLDPAINLEIRELRLKLYEQGTELQKAKDELKAATFSADSVMGRRLINKCKALQEENTDIGKMLLENQLQPLQIQIGILEKQLSFFKQQLKVLHELNADLDEENEKLTSQLQGVTLQYKVAQQERDALAKERPEKLKQSSTSPIRRSGSHRRSTSRGASYRRSKDTGGGGGGSTGTTGTGGAGSRHQKTDRTTRRRHTSQERSYGRGDRRRSGSNRRGRSESR